MVSRQFNMLYLAHRSMEKVDSDLLNCQILPDQNQKDLNFDLVIKKTFQPREYKTHCRHLVNWSKVNYR